LWRYYIRTKNPEIGFFICIVVIHEFTHYALRFSGIDSTPKSIRRLFRVQDSGYLIERSILIPLCLHTGRDLTAHGLTDHDAKIRWSPEKFTFQEICLGYLSEIQNKYFFIKNEYIQDVIKTGVYRELTSSDIEERPSNIKFIYPMKRHVEDEKVEEITSENVVVVDPLDIKRFVYKIEGAGCKFSEQFEFE
jgi:hypothetical protein